MRRFASLLPALVAAGLFGSALAEPPCPPERASHVRVGAQSFRVEVAATEAQRQTGLSGRPGMAEDAGMLFVMPEPAVHSFWMYDMGFAIDLVWIDADRTVLGAQTLAPCGPHACALHFAPAPVLYALEVNAGRFAGQAGDPVTWTCSP